MDSEFLARISNMSPKRLALLAAQLQQQLDVAKSREHEAIAIIGMGCRLPGGVHDVDGFWQLLHEGRDAIREVPPERWDIDAYYDPEPDAPARMSTRSGGFLDNISDFDAEFFGITPREARTLDPQQRLLLEVAWEAIEHAGIAPQDLVGSASGVFVGICNSDHFQRVLGRGVDEIDAYLASGNAASVAAGRLSYFLGLNGPALSIDTACSSSLVALHLGCRSLRSRESNLALVGGVNVMCSPETTITLTKAHMLAPDGRCKTFDAAADGFARGEGCGVLVLKRLSDALSVGDSILAVIRGTAVNQDGRSGGLTVPNGPAQESVLRAALADARVEASELDYVEAHGTGTSLGDPIEVRALAGALGPGRSKQEPLIIGSVKTNFGHLESAAGIAGVMKVVLALLHERIPKHLHFRKPSPHIAWSDWPVRVATEERAWPRSERRRIAGVSSFGFSGTNAHVVIEEAPHVEKQAADPPSHPLECIPLSARSGVALGKLARSCAEALGSGIDLRDAAYTAGAGRAHFGERLVVVAESSGSAKAALEDFSSGRSNAAVHCGSVEATSPFEVVFLYTGQGSQYPGMAETLYRTCPVFRDTIDRCDEILGPDPQNLTLKSVLAAGPAEGAPVHRTAWTQPALFAVEYALTQLWRSWGIEPAAVLGHSVGEYVAACVAGVFSLEDGLRLIAERGRLLQALPKGGSMAALFTSHEEVAALVRPMADRLAIAAINAPDSVVVSGDSNAIDRLLETFAQRNVQGHRLFVSFAAHSPLVASALPGMERAASGVTMRAPNIPVAWNVTGGAPLPNGAPDAGYWARHLREPVRFAECLASLKGYKAFVEVGPHPVLIALAARNRVDGEPSPLMLGSLRRGKDDWLEMMSSLAKLYVNGAKVEWAGVSGAPRPRKAPWPTYPFQRKTFWIPAGSGERLGERIKRGNSASPWLGMRIPGPKPVFENLLDADATPYLRDHRIGETALVAGPVLMEMAHAAANEALGRQSWSISNFEIREPLTLSMARTIQVHLAEGRQGGTSFSVYSTGLEGEYSWQLHAVGELVPSKGSPTMAGATHEPLSAIERRLGPVESCDGFYERLTELGIHLGAAFRVLVDARRGDGEVLATAELSVERHRDSVEFAHPALLDGALQAVGLSVPAVPDSDDVYLFSGLEHIELTGKLPFRFLCHARLLDASTVAPAEWLAHVTLRTPAGELLGVLRGVCLRRASRATLDRLKGTSHMAELLYRVDWESAACALPAARYFEPASVVNDWAIQRFPVLAREHHLAIYDELLPVLDRSSAGYVGAALRELGFDSTRGRVFRQDSEAGNLKIAPQFSRLFGRMVEMLCEDGVLKRREGELEVVGALPYAPTREEHESQLSRFRGTDGELSTLRRCAERLASVLRGDQDPLQLLFPGGEFAEASKLYVESPFARTYNSVLAETVAKAIAQLPEGALLRILEIGAGTGGTTSYVLPMLPADKVEYTFTDLSPLFLQRAGERFAEYPFLKRSLLDVEQHPGQQGFEPDAYDIVIAANVLHATDDLRRTIDHARWLLASSGMLVLLEGVAPERWVDLTFGLTDGWWRFRDTDLRQSYPLISRASWLALLEDSGFVECVAMPAESSERCARQQALIMGRALARQRSWTLIGDETGLGHVLRERFEKHGDRVNLVAADGFEAQLAASDELVYLGALELEATAAMSDADIDLCERLAGQLPLRWLQRAIREPALGRVWLVTRGAQPAAGVTSPRGHLQSPLWGLGRVFALEQPSKWGGLVDSIPLRFPSRAR